MPDIITKNITSQANGFTTCSYSISAMPLIPYLKLSGFSSEGITWDDVEIANVDKGADGLMFINQKPVILSGSFSLLANSPCRNTLDLLTQSSIPFFGHTMNSAGLELIEENTLTGYKTIYFDGIITSIKAGNDNNKDKGQGEKVYKVAFSEKIILPL